MEPYTVDELFIGVGQRYDVLINASQAMDSYWMNVSFSGSKLCGSSNNPYPATIIRYDGAPDALPSDQGTEPADLSCTDLNMFSPVVPRTVPTDPFSETSDDTLDVHFNNTQNLWYINSGHIKVNWNNPLDQYVINGTNYPSELSVYPISGDNDTVSRRVFVCNNYEHFCRQRI